MTKPIVEPDLKKAGLNPFTIGLTIYTYKKQKKVLNKFKEEDVKEFDLEATPYTKVFEVNGTRKQVSDLPIRSKELYLYLIHAVKVGQDCIFIDRVSYMKMMGIKSLNTFKQAITGLCAGLYTQRHSDLDNFRDVLWINPHYFFKGSRINKYPDQVIIKKVVKPK